MINLTPPHGQTALKHEYVLRIASVYGFALAVVFIASTALMVPTYVLTSAQLKTANKNSEAMETTKAAFKEAATEIQNANAVMGVLRIPNDQVVYSLIIEEIVRNGGDGIALSTFRGAHAAGVLNSVVVQGVAANRRSLASFKDALERSPLFEKAELPIADLAKDTNLPFIVTLTMAPPTSSP